MNIEYGNLLSKAWRITWNNKWLWLLGFLVSSTLNTSFRFNTPSFDTQTPSPSGPRPQLPPEVERLVEQFQRPEVAGILITVACVILLLALVFFVLTTIARGGLIGGIRVADDTGKVGLGEAWGIGLRYFWRMLGLEILQALPIIVVAIVFVIFFIFLSAATFGLGVLCLLPILCILVILFIPYGLIFWLGSFGMVLEDLGVIDSVKRGWEIFKTHPGPVLLVGVILFILLFIVGLVVLIPFVVIAIPAVLAFMGDPQHPNWGLLAGAGLALLCLIPIIWVANGILTTWVYSVWTLLYRQLSGAVPQAPAAPQAPDTSTPLPLTA
jgi:hypothetical protein